MAVLISGCRISSIWSPLSLCVRVSCLCAIGWTLVLWLQFPDSVQTSHSNACGVLLRVRNLNLLSWTRAWALGQVLVTIPVSESLGTGSEGPTPALGLSPGRDHDCLFQITKEGHIFFFFFFCSIGSNYRPRVRLNDNFFLTYLVYEKLSLYVSVKKLT